MTSLYQHACFYQSSYLAPFKLTLTITKHYWDRRIPVVITSTLYYNKLSTSAHSNTDKQAHLQTLEDSKPFVRRVAGSNPALAAT